MLASLDGRPLGGILRSGLGLALSPATLTIAFLAVTGLVFYFLGIDEGGDPFAENRAWLTWKIAAALGIAIGALLGTFGVVEIVRVWRSIVRCLVQRSCTQLRRPWRWLC